MKFGKKQLILSGLVLALGTAVYLNWQFSSNTDLLSGANAVTVSKELGEAEFVNTTTSSTKTEKTTDKSSEKTSENNTEKSSSTASTTADEYFAQAKVNRQQTQDEIAEMTEEILKSAEESDAAKTEAVAQAAQLATIMEQQTNIESLIKAKGFEECLVFIQNNECSIVVRDDQLSSEDAMIIKDIATSQSGVQSDKITITAV